MMYEKVSFLALTEDDIELVRNWRNDEKISRYMEYREYITPEMQLKWFESINNADNFYFIIICEEAKIGLFNIKNIDWKEGYGESGIFIYDDAHLNTILPYIVTLKGFRLSFNEYGLQYVYAHVLKTNKRAIRFNKSFGFELEPNQEHVLNQRYILTRKNYERRADSLEKIVKKSMA